MIDTEFKTDDQSRKDAHFPENRLLAYIFLFLVILSIPVRLFNITAPFHIHAIRQSLNGFIVWNFLEEGVSPLKYQIPVFGPPWRIPFDFPIFQMTAYLTAKIGGPVGINLDTSCRLTGLLYFYLSALLLYLLCRELFRRRQVTWCILLFYLWSPFMILWSRAGMIDYAAVTWALAYTLLFYRWLQRIDNILLVPGIILCGCLAYLTKATTMAAFVVPIGWFILKHLWSEVRQFEGLGKFLHKRKKVVFLILCCVFVPVAVEYAWVMYSDHIKAASPFTAAWTSSALKTWHFGTWNDRMQFEQWWIFVVRITTQIVPYGFILFPVAGLFGLQKYSEDGRELFITGIVGAFLPIAVFLNVYRVHDYYLIAITPFLAIFAGVGIHYLCFQRLQGRHLILIMLAFLCIVSFYKGSWFVRTVLSYHGEHDYCKIGEAVQKWTLPNERVMVTDRCWNPNILYYSRRKGFMFVKKPTEEFPYQFLKKNGFTTIVCKKEHPALFSAWKYRRLLETVADFKIFRVSDMPLKNK